eukprot:tig00000492_g1404.t1
MLMSYFRGASAAAAVTKLIFNHTGADQTWTVPAGVTSVTVKLWGAGGAGTSASGYNPSTGGGGGFVSGTLSVTPDETLVFIVGSAGRNGTGSRSAVYGGGGYTTWGSARSLNASGGGRSAIRVLPLYCTITAM